MLLSVVEIIVLVTAILTNLVLGIAVLLRNKRNALNKAVFGLSMSLGIWSLINYFSIHPILFDQIIWVRLVLGAASLQVCFILVTFLLFPDKNYSTYRKIIISAILYTVFVMALTQTPLVFSTLRETSSGSSPVVSPGILFFMIQVLGFVGAAIIVLTRRYYRSNSRTKLQIRPVLWGIGLCFGLIIFSNFILVAVFSNSKLLQFGPAFTLIFFGSLSYSILRHHLFDVRAAIARAIGYGFSVIAIGLLYTVILYLITSLFSSSSNFTAYQRALYIAASVLIAVTFQALKRRFDILSRFIFYRIGYDTQILLNKFNEIVVSKFTLEDLLSDTELLLRDVVSVSSVTYLLKAQDGRVLSYGTLKANFTSESKAASILEHADRVTSSSIDLTNPDIRDRHFMSFDNFSEIGLLQKLVIDNELQGLMMIGLKKGGNTFTSQDRTVFDLMADELILAVQNAIKVEEIEHFNEQLQGRIENATRELKRSNEKLKALDEAKDEFISMASHQLRTPLTSIKGYLSLVLEGDVGDISPQQREMLAQAFTSSQRMVYLISDLLNVSRLRTGKFLIEPKPTYLPDVVSEELQQVQETAKARKVSIHYDKPTEFATVNLDDTKIRQVIMNFVDNAIYYTPAGGEIQVKLEQKSKSIDFMVIDNGIGVPKSEQHHLFTKFYRAGNARKARPDGTGLGLFMAKKVIVASGGALIFKTQEGKGSTFGFTFPLSTTELKD